MLDYIFIAEKRDYFVGLLIVEAMEMYPRLIGFCVWPFLGQIVLLSCDCLLDQASYRCVTALKTVTLKLSAHYILQGYCYGGIFKIKLFELKISLLSLN